MASDTVNVMMTGWPGVAKIVVRGGVSVTLKGVVTKVDWLNPHIYVYMDVKDQAGKTVNWSVEGAPPNTLYRLGWRKDTLKPGDPVTIDAFKAKDGSSTANARQVLLPDGRKVFAGSADDGGPKATPTK